MPAPPQSTSDPITSDPWSKAAHAGLTLALVLLAAAHAVQLLSPLRLNFDSVLLLKMAEAFEAGRGWNPPDVGSQHPIGYPALIVMLDAAGLVRSSVLVAVNLVSLAIGLWASGGVLRLAFPYLSARGLARRTLLVLTLGSWVVVKHVALPVTDVVYFGVSSVAVLALTRAWASPPRERGRRIAVLLVGAGLAAAAILTRTVGIALLPAILWAAVGQPERVAHTVALLKRHKGLLAGVIVASAAAVAALAVVLSSTTYWIGLMEHYRSAPLPSVLRTTVGDRLLELGQVFLNINAASVPQRLQVVLQVAGAGSSILLVIGAWKTRRHLSPALVYLLAYSAIMIIWPFADPRFWLPVLPLGGAVIVQSLEPLWTTRGGRGLGTVYVVVSVILGAIALGYSTRISLSGDGFPEVFGSGIYSDSYRAALGQPHDPAKVDADVLRLLRRYEPRASKAR